MSRKVPAVVTVVVDGAVTGSYRHTTQKDITDHSRSRKTTPDLACGSLRIALSYDGANRSDEEQTETDFRMFHELRAPGREAIRVSKALLADRD